MAEWIYRPLAYLDEGGILVTVSLALCYFFYRGYSKPTFRSSAPALMTSLGILGTFAGIFVALYEFDASPGEMNDSISAFLGGMRTAFVTSLLGLLFSIVFRSIEHRFPVDTHEQDPLAIEQRNVLEKLDAIRQAIAGDGDSSIVTQIQNLRVENRDGFKKMDGLAETIRDSLLKNLDGLVDDLRNIIAKQLGESLRDLIRNIEEALIKQFGATFVQFNEATQALKKWQEDHRLQVEQLTVAFNLAVRGVAEIVEGCKSIPPTMEQLRPIVETAHRNVESLNRQVEAFAGMRKQAEESFPAIKRNLDEIGENLSSSARGFETMEETLKEAFESAEEQTRRIAELHARNVERITANMIQTLEGVQQESAARVTGIVESALNKFSSEVSEELDRVATAWGSNLVSIAERCSEAIRVVDGTRPQP